MSYDDWKTDDGLEEADEVETAARRVAAATSLGDLLTALRAFDETLGEETDAERYVHFTDLPTFGPEVWDTDGVWSWDATHILAGTCIADLSIIPRRDIGGSL